MIKIGEEDEDKLYLVDPLYSKKEDKSQCLIKNSKGFPKKKYFEYPHRDR